MAVGGDNAQAVRVELPVGDPVAGAGRSAFPFLICGVQLQRAAKHVLIELHSVARPALEVDKRDELHLAHRRGSSVNVRRASSRAVMISVYTQFAFGGRNPQIIYSTNSTTSRALGRAVGSPGRSTACRTRGPSRAGCIPSSPRRRASPRSRACRLTARS